MAEKTYAHGVHEIDDNASPAYTRFRAVWVAWDEATQLAFADRLAERARLLRKAILNRTVVNEAEDTYLGVTSPVHAITPEDLVNPWNSVKVVAAAVDCFKAANNDV